MDKKRFKFSIGRGTAIALIIVFVMVGQSYMTRLKQRNARLAPHKTPVVAPAALPNEPDMAAILNKSAELKLTAAQAGRLNELIDEWARVSVEVVADVKSESVEFEKRMNGMLEKKLTVRELRKQSQPLSDATSKYVALKNDFQARAEAVLDAQQKDLWQKIKKESRKQQ